MFKEKKKKIQKKGKNMYNNNSKIIITYYIIIVYKNLINILIKNTKNAGSEIRTRASFDSAS